MRGGYFGHAGGVEHPFFESRSASGVSYEAVVPSRASEFKSGLIGWQVRSEKQVNGSSAATMTPYLESTGPRDPGDGFRWVDTRLGKSGIIIVPPSGYVAGEDIMRSTAGELVAIATSSAGLLARFAGPQASPRGFVLYEPSDGWQQAAGKPGTSGIVLPVLLVGGMVALVAVGWYAFRR